ncbi:potassium channel family protein [Kistimonas scapharcae]|uniref:Potassium channel family protein n=1 Tax=Kistimonas scapharcae TaxID=1036133 RepID=A0ABP8V9B2_9GAMM
MVFLGNFRQTEVPRFGFSMLLLMLMTVVVVFPFMPDVIRAGFMLKVSLTMLLVASVYILSHKRKFLIIASMLAFPTFITLWLPVLYNKPTFIFLDNITNLMFFSYVIYELLVLIFSAKRVDRNIIYGSMCVYMLLGLQGAFIYTLLEFWMPGSFHGEGLASIHDISTFIYFSFVTLSTLGYGDIVPATRAAQAIASMEALIGQFYLTVLVARLVGIHISQR